MILSFTLPREGRSGSDGEGIGGNFGSKRWQFTSVALPRLRAVELFFTRREMRGWLKAFDEPKPTRSRPFSPSYGDMVAGGGMWGSSSDCIVQTAPHPSPLPPICRERSL
jgi:hypothetical protein